MAVNAGYTTIKGTPTGSNADRINLFAEYKVTAQDAQKNTSTLDVFFYIGLKDEKTSSTKRESTLSYSVDGQSIETKVDVNFEGRKGPYNIQLAHRTYTIIHNSDGMKSVVVKLSLKTGSSYVSGGTINATISLPAIARPVMFGQLPQTIAIGERFTVSFIKQDESYTSRLYIELGEGSVNTSASGNEMEVFFPESFLSYIPGTSAQGQLRLESYNGNEHIGSITAQINVTVPEDIKPTLETTYEIKHSRTDLDWNVMATGISGITIHAKGTAPEGATISKYEYVIGGAKFPQTGEECSYEVFTKAGTYTAVVKVYDSRGRTAEKSFDFVVYSYAAPSVVAEIFRCDATGNKSNGSNATYASCKATYSYSSVEGNNSVSARLYMKAEGEADFTEVVGYEIVSGEALFLSGIDISKSYQIKFEIADEIQGVAYVSLIPSIERIIKVKKGGKAIGIGGDPEEDGVTVFWPSVFEGDVVFKGNVSGADANGALKIQTGTGYANSSSAKTISFAETFNTVPVVVATWETKTSGSYGALKVRDITVNGFGVVSGGSTPSNDDKINWIAIGT